MGTDYESDVVAWANEQAALLRARQFSALDVENIAEEIESVGRSEQRELKNHMAMLVARLLKWQYQSGGRCSARQRVIKELRRIIDIMFRMAPALKGSLTDPYLIAGVWSDAIIQSVEELAVALPETCPWTLEQALDEAFLPD